MHDRTGFRGRSVAAFVVLTLGATWLLEFALIGGGMRFDDMSDLDAPALWLLPVMMVPGAAAALTARFVEGVPFSRLRDELGLRLGTSTGPYFLTILLIPLMFAVIYGISTGLGLADYAPPSGELDEDFLWKVALPLSMALGPFINLIFGLGEEIGWRGFLLPRLLPMGKGTAYLVLGVIWGHEMALHYRSSILAGFIHAAFNAQGFGVWVWLFPEADPILAGPFGLVGAVCWLLLGLITVRSLTRLGAD